MNDSNERAQRVSKALEDAKRMRRVYLFVILASVAIFMAVVTHKVIITESEVVEASVPLEESVPLDETIRQRSITTVVTFMATVVDDPTLIGQTDMVEVFVKGEKRDRRAFLHRVLAPKSADLHVGDRVEVKIFDVQGSYYTTLSTSAIARKVGPDYVVENKE